ncbi:MAG: hypothetical protein ABNH21_12940, partial [Glaciecola sp.]
KVLVASKQKRGSSNDLGWLFVCNKHITLIIIVDEYLRLNDNIWMACDLHQSVKSEAKAVIDF